MKFDISISFRGMDKEVNDSLYRVHFPEYTHILYTPPVPKSMSEAMLDALIFEGPIYMAHCGKVSWKSRYGVYKGADKLDLATLVDDPEDATCPKCIEYFVFATLRDLP